LEVAYREGGRGEAPSKIIFPHSPFKETNLTGCLRGAQPLSINCLPLPLDKGKGINGDRVDKISLKAL